VKKENLSFGLNEIDDKYIAEAADYADNIEQNQMPQRSVAKRPRMFNRVALAACLVLIAVIVASSFAIVAEAKEYNAAVAFFEENGLSPDGLSRSDIKAVYRDIITRSFTYGKTSEVIRNSVPGMEIAQKEPSPKELLDFWDNNAWIRSLPKNGIGYHSESVYNENERSGFIVLDKSTLECYRDRRLIWSAEFTDFAIVDSSYMSDSTAVWGLNIFSSELAAHYWIARVDENGNIAWKHQIYNGFKNEYIVTVLNNGDGTWEVVSRGDFKYLCLSRYDAEGNKIRFEKTEIGNHLGILNAARLGDGYMVQVGTLIDHDTARLLRLDSDGKVLDSYSYEAEDCEYYIADMIEFGGQIYLSAYAVPKPDNLRFTHEIANVLDHVYERYVSGWDITEEELTPLVRDNYTAVLLICDAEGGNPRKFYSVNGSLGGKLSVNEKGRLEWYVESITSTFFSPTTSSFTIGGTSKVYRYTFDTSGTLIGQTDTGENVRFGK